MRGVTALVTIALLGGGAFGGAQGAPPNGESWALFQGWKRARRIDFLVPAGPCERAATALAMELGTELQVSLDPADRDPAALRVLVGAPWDPALAPLAHVLGIEPIAGGFCLLGREYTDEGDALLAVFADPAAPSNGMRPLCLLLGNDLGRLAAYLDRLPRLARPWLTVWSAGELALECPLSETGVPREAEAQDYLARRTRYFEGGRSYDVEGARVHLRNPLSRDRWQAYVLALLGARKRTLGWFGAKDPPVVDVFVYEHAEDMEDCLGASAITVCNRIVPRVHVLVAPGLPDDSGAGLARVLARAVAGPPASEWLAEGESIAASGRYWRRPLDEWIAHLASARVLPSWDEVLGPDAGERTSEHALAPARALLFEQAVDGAEAGRVRALWKGAGLEPKRIGGLYQRAVQTAMRASRATPAAPDRARKVEFLHGLALVEGPGGSYSSSWVDEALDEARALAPGPDAVSLSLFATAEDPAPPLAGARRVAAYGSASDLALASASAAAHARKLRVLLALEVLAQPSGAWADVLPWASPEDRWTFAPRYKRVALHYGLLAELLGCELFSFGANLRESPSGTFEGEDTTQEQVQQRRLSWLELATKLHAAFTGGLTYGARPETLSEDVAFFEKLDYLGVQLYPGLERGADGGAPGEPDDELLQRMLRFEVQQALDLAVRWNKPLLFVQLGYPARRDSWAAPAVPRGPLDLAAQQRMYAALADVLASAKPENDGPLKGGLENGGLENGGLENRDSLGGYFLWNWPIEAREPDSTEDPFALRGRPVEAILPRLFAR